MQTIPLLTVSNIFMADEMRDGIAVTETWKSRPRRLGLSRLNRLLVVVHTGRGRKIRIISARVMTKSERAIYEEG